MVFVALPIVLFLTYLTLVFLGVVDFVAMTLLLVAVFAALPCVLLALRQPPRLWRIIAAAAAYGGFWWLLGAGSMLAGSSDRFGPLILGHQLKENDTITLGGGLWLTAFALSFSGVMFVVLLVVTLLPRVLKSRDPARLGRRG